MNLSWDQYRRVGQALGLHPAIVKAVALVESPRGPWITYKGQNRPSILFEPHHFYRFSGSRPFSRTHPHLSRATPLPPGGYGTFSRQWDLYEEAKREGAEWAAMMSCSWGAFQIMGFNHKVCGFETVEAFVESMWESEERHLDAFAAFLNANGLVPFLQRREWAEFARRYNGPAYARNEYDVKLRRAYEAAEREYVSLPAPRPNQDSGTEVASILADIDAILERAAELRSRVARLTAE